MKPGAYILLGLSVCLGESGFGDVRVAVPRPVLSLELPRLIEDFSSPEWPLDASERCIFWADFDALRLEKKDLDGSRACLLACWDEGGYGGMAVIAGVCGCSALFVTFSGSRTGSFDDVDVTGLIVEPFGNVDVGPSFWDGDVFD